jgi:hypothetical protein
MSDMGVDLPPERSLPGDEQGEELLPSTTAVPRRTARRDPKKKQPRLLAVVGGIIAVCLIGVGAVALVSASSQRAAVRKSIAQAEAHFGSAMASVSKAATSLSAAKSGSTSQTAKAVAGAGKELSAARGQIASAKASAGQIGDSQGKADYLAGLATATTTLNTLQELVTYMSATNGMAAKALQAGALATKANKQLDQAISRANGGSYGEMRSQARSASANYAKAAVLFRQADKIDPTAGLKKAAIYCDKRKAQADIVARMADEGAAKQISAYNADIKKQAALGLDAEAVGAPVIVSDPSWGQKRVDALAAKIEASAKQADDLRAKALKELGATR